MKVVLVHPAGSNWIPGKKDVTVVANRMVPIGILSIAAYLEKHGHTVYVHDCLGRSALHGTEDNVDRILDLKPDLVGFSTTTSAFMDASQMATLIKASAPDTRTVFGGVHVSGVGETLLRDFPCIDFLALGEGEETLSELASGQEPVHVNGLVWRDGEQIVTNPPRVKIADLDELPFPVYEKLEGFPNGYRLPPFSYIDTPGTAISTSRGCVYQCSYCDRSVFKKGFRSNSAEYTFEHIKYLKDRFGIRHVNVYDDLFTTNRKRILSLCEMLASAGIRIRFNCSVRVGHADNELLRALKSAGCLMVSVGIESGDPKLLQELKSDVTLDQVKETVNSIQKAGLRAKGLFMMGVVGETEESIKKTSDFIIDVGFDDMNMSKFTPFPGAPCYSTIKEHGEFNEDWRLMNALNFVFIPRGIGSRERLDQLYNRHVKRFYTDPSWRKRFRKRLWQHRATIWYMLKNLPSFLEAKKRFEPKL